MSLITDKRLIFVGGCSGAGKTTIAAALALLASRRGKRVLVVSTDGDNSLSAAFTWEIGEQGAAVCAGVHALEMNTTDQATLIDRICSLIEDAEDYYDLVIFDSSPYAQANTLDSASAEQRALFDRCYQRFQDADNTAFMLVLTPESDSVGQAQALLLAWQAKALPVHTLLVNQVSPESHPVQTLHTVQHAMPLLPTPVQGIAALQQTAVLLDQFDV